MFRWLIIVIVIGLASCNPNNVELMLDGNNDAKALIFLAPDCPLCKNYTKNIKELIELYGNKLDFFGVIPGTYYSRIEVDSFLNQYDLPLEIIYDSDYELVKELNATITPEVYLINENNKIIYQGLFDNWLGELGRRRQIITEFYFKQAIESYLKGEEIINPKTKAIGCFIE